MPSPEHTPAIQESARIRTLRDHPISHIAADQVCQHVLDLAACLCEVPFAAITLIDSDRQYFKAALGFEGTSMPRQHSFCTHTIQQKGVMVVENAMMDDRFRTNPLVVNQPNLRFYAGASLITEDGAAIGSLCALGTYPRSFTQVQREGLQLLAEHLMWFFSQPAEALSARVQDRVLASTMQLDAGEQSF